MLQPFLLVVTVALTLGCTRVCARVYGRQKAALVSERTRSRWRRLVVGAGAQPSGLVESHDPAVARELIDGDAPLENGAALGENAGDESAPASARKALEERVLREVLAAPTRPLAVLAMNELVQEVGRAVSDARTLPPAVGRVALFGGTALGLTAMATSLGNGQGATATLWGGACLLLAMVGAGVCGVYGRLARKAAEQRREQTRELIRLLERRLPST